MIIAVMTLLSQPVEESPPEPPVEVVAPPPVTTQAVTDTYEATAYIALCDTGCSGVTYTGHDARQSIYTAEGHRVIAVDPSVIPLYSIVSVTQADGTTFTAQALDIGSAINGKSLDLLVASESEAWQFGRQSVEVELKTERERLRMTKLIIGGKVRFIGEERDYADLTHGKEYEIYEIENNEEIVILDDIGDERSFWLTDGEFELVTEQPVEASPSVIELLSNLALRLTKVEAKIGINAIKPTDDEVDNGTTTQSDSVDNVNSPQHYRHGRFETIELIEDITKKYDDGFVAYCVGNAVKYIDRAPFKHGSPSEDLRKAAWYLTRAAEHTDATTPPSA